MDSDRTGAINPTDVGPLSVVIMGIDVVQKMVQAQDVKRHGQVLVKNRLSHSP